MSVPFWNMRQAAKAWRVSTVWASKLAPSVPGAFRSGRSWLVPAGARKPDRPMGRPKGSKGRMRKDQKAHG